VKVLEAHGYRVIPARDGVDAVEKFRDHADIVDLLILDVLMPRMNGKEAFTEIRKHRQDIRTLFMSGYSFDDMRQKGVNADDITIIPKPFSTASFLRKVRDTLAGGDNAGLPANTN
jgi:DNA-binding response OmpR family regulator